VIEHLKDDGLFIARECLRPDRTKVNLVKVAKEHYKKYADKYSFYETSMQYMYASLPDSKTNVCHDLKGTQKVLDDVYKKGIFTEKDYIFLTRALTVESGTLSVMIKKDFELRVNKYFDIVKEHHVKEPSSN
jgi:hypothetical protein